MIEWAFLLGPGWGAGLEEKNKKVEKKNCQQRLRNPLFGRAKGKFRAEK